MTTDPTNNQTARRSHDSLKRLGSVLLFGLARLAMAVSVAAALGLILMNAVVDAIVYALAAMLALFFSCCGNCSGRAADASPMSANDVGSRSSVVMTIERLT